jgi:hypothetical protein
MWLRTDKRGVSSLRHTRWVQEVTVNVQAFEELKRVLRTVPESEFSIADWDRCACGHATRDSWFRQQGFTDCRDFFRAAAFFQVPRWKAEELFSAPYRTIVTPSALIQQIDSMLPAEAVHPSAAPAQTARRQSVIDDLLVKANKAARRGCRWSSECRKPARSLAIGLQPPACTEACP